MILPFCHPAPRPLLSHWRPVMSLGCVTDAIWSTDGRKARRPTCSGLPDPCRAQSQLGSFSPDTEPWKCHSFPDIPSRLARGQQVTCSDSFQCNKNPSGPAMLETFHLFLPVIRAWRADRISAGETGLSARLSQGAGFSPLSWASAMLSRGGAPLSNFPTPRPWGACSLLNDHILSKSFYRIIAQNATSL